MMEATGALINKSLVIFILVSSLSLYGQLKEEALAIKEVIQEAYIDGVFNEGNVRNVELGFSEHFQMLAIDDNGEQKVYNRDYFINRIQAKKAAGMYPPSPDKMVRYKILRTDVEGDAASVKMHFYYGNKLAYIDLLHLVKSKGGWLISHKVFKTLKEPKQTGG